MREYRSEDPLEKGVLRVEGIEDSDGGDCHRLGGIDVDELVFALLLLVGLPAYSVLHFFLSLLQSLSASFPKVIQVDQANCLRLEQIFSRGFRVCEGARR